MCLGVWGVRPPSEGTAAASELSLGLEGLERDVLLPGKGANVGCHTGRAWGAWVSPPLVAARRDDLATTPPPWLGSALLAELRDGVHSVLPSRVF